MRIKLKQGKQKELLLNVKHKYKYSWKQLANKLKINDCYLRNELKNEKCLLSDNIFKILNSLSNNNYVSFIETQKLNSWGKQKGGSLSKSKPKEVKLLLEQRDENLAELIGIILGDGNLYVNSNHGVYLVRVSGHALDDKEYLTTHVSGLFRSLFNKVPSLYLHSKPDEHNELFVQVQSKDLIHTLVHHGLLIGNKVQNNVSVPRWILDNRSFMAACVRGLLDTDGCVAPKTKKHPLPSIWFSSSIPNLRKDFSFMLKQLGFSPSKWTQRKNAQCCLGKQEEVRTYLNTIGFNNSKHSVKFEKYALMV